jgi:hypothetical protein
MLKFLEQLPHKEQSLYLLLKNFEDKIFPFSNGSTLVPDKDEWELNIRFMETIFRQYDIDLSIDKNKCNIVDIIDKLPENFRLFYLNMFYLEKDLIKYKDNDPCILYIIYEERLSKIGIKVCKHKEITKPEKVGKLTQNDKKVIPMRNNIQMSEHDHQLDNKLGKWLISSSDDDELSKEQ